MATFQGEYTILHINNLFCETKRVLAGLPSSQSCCVAAIIPSIEAGLLSNNQNHPIRDWRRTSLIPYTHNPWLHPILPPTWIVFWGVSQYSNEAFFLSPGKQPGVEACWDSVSCGDFPALDGGRQTWKRDQEMPGYTLISHVFSWSLITWWRQLSPLPSPVTFCTILLSLPLWTDSRTQSLSLRSNNFNTAFLSLPKSSSSSSAPTFTDRAAPMSLSAL